MQAIMTTHRRKATATYPSKSMYDQVYEKASPIITNYREDLEVHDKNELEGYTGDFIHMTRPSGTWIILLYPANHAIWPSKGLEVPYLFGHATREHIVEGLRAYTSEHTLREHKLFLYGHNGKVKEISGKEVSEIVEKYIKLTLDTWRKL